MRIKLRSLSRCRPRLLTLAIFFVIAAVLVLANAAYPIGGLSNDRKLQCLHGMYIGWPLIWYRFVTGDDLGLSGGWQVNAVRLASNAAMWLLMLVAPAAICEWLLRRYRPRLRWSLRTMLVAVALVAALCGWYAVARDRANKQDAIIAKHRHLRVERWGPRWLDLLGLDRFRRQIVAAKVEDEYEAAERSLDKLARLPGVECVFLEVDRLTRGIVETLGRMPRLRILRVDLRYGSDEEGYRRVSAECLEALGKLTQLEHLRLESMTIGGDDLRSLAGLVNLKSLSLDSISTESPPLLRGLASLPLLDAVDITDSDIGDDDVSFLAALPRLRSLSLQGNCELTDWALREVASAKALEALEIGGDVLSASGLSSLQATKWLRRLCIRGHRSYSDSWEPQAALPLDDGSKVDVPEDDVEGCLRALQELRRSNPGIVIGRDTSAFAWAEHHWRWIEEESVNRPTGPLYFPWLRAAFFNTAPLEQAKDLPW